MYIYINLTIADNGVYMKLQVFYNIERLHIIDTLKIYVNYNCGYLDDYSILRKLI